MSRLVFALAVLVSAVHAADPSFLVETVSGERFQDRPRAISNGVVSWESKRKPLKWERIVCLRQLETPRTVGGAVTILVADGTEVHGDQVTLQNGKLILQRRRVKWSVAPVMVRGVRLQSLKGRALRLWLQALVVPARHDRLLLRRDESLSWVVADSVRIAVDAVSFRSAGKARIVKREDVFAVTFRGAPPMATPTDKRAVVLLADGSQILGHLQSIAVGRVTMRSLAGDFTLPLADLISISHASGEATYLSDLSTIRAGQTSLISSPSPSFFSRQSTFRDMRYQGGIAAGGVRMHADAYLEFSIPAKTRRFLASAVLAEPTGRYGDCVVRVLLDGQEVFRERLNRQQSLAGVAVNAKGKVLRLEVLKGAGLDLGDHVIWAEARFSK